MVWTEEMPSSLVRPLQMVEVKWRPWSEVIVARIPNLATHEEKSTSTQASAVMHFIGAASSHLVDLFPMVNRYGNLA